MVVLHWWSLPWNTRSCIRTLVQHHITTFAHGFIHMVMICSCLMPSPNIDFRWDIARIWQNFIYNWIDHIIKKGRAHPLKKLNLQYFYFCFSKCVVLLLLLLLVVSWQCASRFGLICSVPNRQRTHTHDCICTWYMTCIQSIREKCSSNAF